VGPLVAGREGSLRAGLAAERGVQALAVLTVSDHVLRHEMMSAEQREVGLDRMIVLTLDALTSVTQEP